MATLKETIKEDITEALGITKPECFEEELGAAADAALDVLHIPVWLWDIDVARIESYTLTLKSEEQ